jgi:hypothetical protein
MTPMMKVSLRLWALLNLTSDYDAVLKENTASLLIRAQPCLALTLIPNQHTGVFVYVLGRDQKACRKYCVNKLQYILPTDRLPLIRYRSKQQLICGLNNIIILCK